MRVIERTVNGGLMSKIKVRRRDFPGGDVCIHVYIKILCLWLAIYVQLVEGK